MTTADTPSGDRLLTIDEAAEYLGQSPRTVRRKIAAREIPAVRLSSSPFGRLRIREAELLAWLIGSGK